jgi:hypothetical protein
LIAKCLLYTSAWWFCVAVLAAGVGEQIVCELAARVMYSQPELEPGPSEWSWCAGAPARNGYWPWVCWVSAALVTLQAVHLLYFTRRPQILPSATSPTRVRVIVFLGWVAALYLLLFDHYFHLRFYLQFGVGDWRYLYPWSYR